MQLKNSTDLFVYLPPFISLNLRLFLFSFIWGSTNQICLEKRWGYTAQKSLVDHTERVFDQESDHSVRSEQLER